MRKLLIAILRHKDQHSILNIMLRIVRLALTLQRNAVANLY